MKDIPLQRIARFYLAVSIAIMFILVAFPQGSLALSFNNFSVGGTGSINTGNGYFDNDASQFGFTGTRNIYIVTEDTQIILVEPISYTGGVSGAYTVITSPSATLLDAVVFKGYVYFINGTTLYKKKTRNDGSVCAGGDTSAGGCIQTITSGIGGTLRVYNGVLYFTVGTNKLKHLDSSDSVVSDFDISIPPNGEAQHNGYTIASNNGVLTIFLTSAYSGTAVSSQYCTSVACTNLYTSGVTSVSWSTYYTTSNYAYQLLYAVTGSNTNESLWAITNKSHTTVDYVVTNTLAQNNRVYVGGESTLGLMATSVTAYETFNANEVGIGSAPVIPSEITYSVKAVESQYSSYYNMSNFILIYQIEFGSLSNLGIDTADYRWQIDLIDPNNVKVNTYQSPQCTFGFPDIFTCSINEVKSYSPSSYGWLQGSWTAKIYELNIQTNHRALLATSTSWQVLNTTLNNQSIINTPITPITSGSGATSLTIIDNWTSLIGLGVNAISKFLFGMLIITVFTFFGFVATKFNIQGGILTGLFPYTFFIFIGYLPLWTIVIITMIVGMKLFR